MGTAHALCACCAQPPPMSSHHILFCFLFTSCTLPPPVSIPPPPRGRTVAWPMNNKKSIGNRLFTSCNTPFFAVTLSARAPPGLCLEGDISAVRAVHHAVRARCIGFPSRPADTQPAHKSVTIACACGRTPGAGLGRRRREGGRGAGTGGTGGGDCGRGRGRGGQAFA